MKTNTATILIAMVAMIGMTGFAAAGSTTQTWTGDGQYNTAFGGMGTGDLTIFTHTSYGDDRMLVDWQDTNVVGNQNMNTGSQTNIARGVTVGTGGWLQAASGTVETFTNSADEGDGHYVYTLSTYADDVAGGSYVCLDQGIHLKDNGPDEILSGNAGIDGYAYGSSTLVSGLVEAGAGTMFARGSVDVTEGSFNMDMTTKAKDNPTSYLDRAKLRSIAVTATGVGTADVVGSGDNVRVGLVTTNDGIGIMTTGSQGTYFDQDDAFDTSYTATGYIYTIELP